MFLPQYPPAIRRIDGPADAMQQIAKRLEIGLLARGREFEMKRNSCQGTHAQVIRMGAAATPHARLRFHGRAIFASRRPHRHALKKTRAGHAARHEQLLQHSSFNDRAPLEL
jgi:hypothetical protein